jgi:1-aminocyclopropane-1-carboxylate deaminase/D-cysteine desulfhydrase-like pyridoxal-dependent ACC family enzyme
LAVETIPSEAELVNQPYRPLFDAYPDLRSRVPFIPLADLPTPLQRLEHLSTHLGAEVWVKRDGLTHPIYGGNKIRKFEFVFGDLLRRGSRVVITGGGLGSHHTLATAVIARQFGVQPVLCYYCQPLTDEVRRNLLYSSPLDVDAHFCGDYVGLVVSFLWQAVRWAVRSRCLPYFVYPGASGHLGILGYVNAAFELKAQLLARGSEPALAASYAPVHATAGAPVPDAVFAAVGSCGTLAGLLLGARLAGLPGRIIGVRVTEADVANQAKIARLATKAGRYLHNMDSSVPPVRIEPDEVELLDAYLGPGYAHPTPTAERAVHLLKSAESLPLETTYTGKAMAALLDYARLNPGARLLFIDTFAEAPSLNQGDYQSLPKRFWGVFEPSHRMNCHCLRSWRDPGFCWKRQGQG